jgi:hypothetical protein
MCQTLNTPLVQSQASLTKPGGPDEQTKAIIPIKPVPAIKRLKIWELEERFHCPVVGTCLTVDEIKKLAKRAGHGVISHDDYQLHIEAVSVSCRRCEASEDMQRMLERKYAVMLYRFAKAKDEVAVFDLWKQAFEKGEVAAGMWAAMTHKHANEWLRQRVYADVHMLSHQVGAGTAADLRKLVWLEQQYALLKEEHRSAQDRLQKDLRRRDQQIEVLKQDVERAKARALESNPLKEKLESYENGLAATRLAQSHHAMAHRFDKLTADQAALQAELDRLRAENAQLKEDCEDLTHERDGLAAYFDKVNASQPVRTPRSDVQQIRLEGLLAKTSSKSQHQSHDHHQGDDLSHQHGHDDGGQCQGQCGACTSRLRGRCVLCVGGRTGLMPQYRELAERLGVRLVTHDGGKEEALSRLNALLASSDAVICPTDTVGHLAYYQVKDHCKQANKPCVLIKRSGVAGFAAALMKLQRGEAQISAGY